MNEPPIGRVRGLNEPPAAPPKDEPNAGGPKPERREPAPAPSAAFAQPPVAPPKPDRPAGPKSARDDDGPAPRRPEQVDSDIDSALDRAMGKRRDEDDALLNFKRMKDEEIEAELESLMAGFDPDDLQVSKPGRTRAADRAHVPKGGVGQEERHGIQQAKVVAVRGDTVFLDLGAKSEGVVPADQFGAEVPSPGDMVEVVFDRYDKEEGLLIMSRKGAATIATWENLQRGMIVEARGVKEVKGGLEVEVNGIRGFMPISQIDLNRIETVTPYVNEKLRAQVTEVNPREKNLVVSRRALLEAERAEMREKTWAELEVDQVREGVVRSIKPFGAFVDLGGVDGLIPVGELGWHRVNDPSEVVKTGQTVEVKVLKIDKDADRVTLSLRALASSPWDDIEDRFATGETVRGKVTKLMDFGAFVELEPGIEGLIHISELGPKKVYRVKDVVQPGQEVDVRILKIEPDLKRISLSLRPLAPAPVAEPEEDEADDTPPAPKPERKVPLKGGLGDRDPNPFGSPPK
jgi:small subunit ribosomal protein S1